MLTAEESVFEKGYIYFDRKQKIDEMNIGFYICVSEDMFQGLHEKMGEFLDKLDECSRPTLPSGPKKLKPALFKLTPKNFFSCRQCNDNKSNNFFDNRNCSYNNISLYGTKKVSSLSVIRDKINEQINLRQILDYSGEIISPSFSVDLEIILNSFAFYNDDREIFIRESEKRFQIICDSNVVLTKPDKDSQPFKDVVTRAKGCKALKPKIF